MTTTRRPNIKISTLGRWACYERDHYECVWCGCKVIPGSHQGDDLASAQLDHRVCYSHGGADAPSNLMTSCSSCNASRKDKTVKAYKWRCGWEGRDVDAISVRIKRTYKAPSIAAYKRAAEAIALHEAEKAA